MQQRDRAKRRRAMAAGVVIAGSGLLGIEAQAGILIKRPLQPTGVDADARGHTIVVINHNGGRGRLRVRGANLAPASTFSIVLGGIRIGRLVTGVRGDGHARVSTRPGRREPTPAGAARARVGAAPDRAAARARPRTRWSASSSRPTTAWRSTACRWTPARAIRTHVPPRPDALTRARGAGDVPGMTRHVLVALVCALPALARADLSAEVKTHEETFARACAAGDIPAVLALYADDARLVWPDAGEEGRGKADIERLATAFCKHTNDLQLTLASLDAVPIDDTHVATVAHWEMSATAPDGKKLSAKVRSTEVLVKTGGTWRYLVDHASLGRPPAPTATRRTRRRR